MDKQRIGITGASGTIGRLLAAGLTGTHRLALFDRRPLPISEPCTANSHDCFTQIDLAHRDAIRGHFDGLNVVIHLAANADPMAPWDSLLAGNIDATENVLDEALASGVQKVIFASSCHAQHGASMGAAVNALDPAFLATGRVLRTTDPPHPDSLYGVSKVVGEQLGRYYATCHGIQFVGLRIGWVFIEDDPTIQRGHISETFARAVYLSHRDCLALFRCAIQVDAPFVLAYGISANTHTIFDLAETRQVLGYAPQDNAERRFAE